VRPVLISLGSFKIQSYGFMLMLAFAAGVLWTAREARRRGVSPEHVLDYALWALLSSVIGSRVVFLLLNFDWYRTHPEQILGWRVGGLSFHGGLGAAVLALYLFCRKRKLRFILFTDLFAPAVPLGYAFARIGCFLNGCCYGGPTHLPWACRFPDEHLPGALTAPSHPVQLYACALSLLLFGLLVWRRHHARFEGQLTLWYFLGYAVQRFALEFLRAGYTGKGLVWGLTEAQVASVVMFVLALVALVRGLRRAGAQPEEDHRANKKRPDSAR